MALKNRGIGGGHSVCSFCKSPIIDLETARTTATPPGRQPLTVGSGWVICGTSCSELPEGATVFYRPLGNAWGK